MPNHAMALNSQKSAVKNLYICGLYFTKPIKLQKSWIRINHLPKRLRNLIKKRNRTENLDKSDTTLF